MHTCHGQLQESSTVLRDFIHLDHHLIDHLDVFASMSSLARSISPMMAEVNAEADFAMPQVASKKIIFPV
jgi:hypothetical protein